jgi:phage gp46-like protein
MQVRCVLQTATTREGDLERDAKGRIVRDDGLQTFFEVRLFTDAKASPEQLARAGLEQRGYWFDAYDDDPARNTGSLLWLLEPRVIDAEALADAQTWTEEAVASAVTKGVASKVDVTVERLGDSAISIDLAAYQPGATSPYRRTWEVYFGV